MASGYSKSTGLKTRKGRLIELAYEWEQEEEKVS